jgi:hypothetical protein
MTQNAPSDSTELTRMTLGYNLINRACITIVILFGGLVLLYLIKGTADTSLVTAFSSVITVVGTLVGAFFGYQQGASGKEAAEERASKAEHEVRALVAAAPQDVIQHAQQLYPDLFK